MNINPTHINTIGLIFDIACAWLVAWEVVRQYHGKKIDKSPYLHDVDDPPFETEEYKKWEKKKYKRMKYGLVCLTIGFGLQIFTNYLSINNFQNIIPQSTINETRPTITPPQNSIPEPTMSPKTKVIPPIKPSATSIK